VATDLVEQRSGASEWQMRRRSNVVGISPNREVLIRLIRAAPTEYNGEWMITRRCMSIGALQKAQAAADEGGSEGQEPEQPTPTLVRQLAA